MKWYEHDFELEFELSTNSFIDKSDPFGLIHSDPEPIKFYTFEKVTMFKAARLYWRFNEWNPYKKEKRFSMPITFTLSDIAKTYEREAYTLMAALSDFGGFNDGIILFPAIFM